MSLIAVVGLGYVGLPLAVLLAEKYDVVGYDVNEARVEELRSCFDHNQVFSEEVLGNIKRLFYSSSSKCLAAADVFIITVPTPVHFNKNPDLGPLELASKEVASHLKKNSLVIYESTVYPGCTEEFCVPILEKVSGLRLNEDFYCGYSPERMNPGDKEHALENVVKITSGSSQEALKRVDQLYKSIITAGTYPVGSMRVAESAKIIENCQRDLNIALMNELEIMFDRMGVDIDEVLEAASTKWNFLNFKPGLVGGHCIGVDPYYLAHKAKEIGLHPAVVLAGRKINDEHASYYAHKILVRLVQREINPIGAKVLIIGLSFKSNCRDIRNSKVVDVIEHLNEVGCIVSVYDPLVREKDAAQVILSQFYSSLDRVRSLEFDLVVSLVLHDDFDYSALTAGNYLPLVHGRGSR